MSVLQVELPDELHAELEAECRLRQAPAASLVAEAVRALLGEWQEVRQLDERAAKGSREAFLRVLDKVPAVEPAAEDRLP